MYYVIRNSDGETHVEEVNEKTLKQRLSDKYYGEVGFLYRIGTDTDTSCWGDNILIIKGEAIMPRPVQTVTEYKL